jgi:hypothetical protein
VREDNSAGQAAGGGVMPTSPWESRRMTGRAMSSTRVRRWMPAASLSLDANPSLTHESWFPLVRITGMRA